MRATSAAAWLDTSPASPLAATTTDPDFMRDASSAGVSLCVTGVGLYWLSGEASPKNLALWKDTNVCEGLLGDVPLCTTVNLEGAPELQMRPGPHPGVGAGTLAGGPANPCPDY